MKTANETVFEGEIIDPDEEQNDQKTISNHQNGDVQIGLNEALKNPSKAAQKVSNNHGVKVACGAVAIGAIAGSIIPGIGTTIGAGLGGIIGGCIAISKGIQNNRKDQKKPKLK